MGPRVPLRPEAGAIIVASDCKPLATITPAIGGMSRAKCPAIAKSLAIATAVVSELSTPAYQAARPPTRLPASRAAAARLPSPGSCKLIGNDYADYGLADYGLRQAKPCRPKSSPNTGSARKAPPEGAENA